MAEGSQDRIDIAFGADTSGLDDGERRAVAFVDRIQQTIASRHLPPLDINVGPFLAGLERSGLAGEQFFAGLQQGVNEALAEMEAKLGTAGASAGTLAGELARPIELNVTPALTASDALIGKLGLVTRTAATTREALRAPLGPPVAPTPTLLASQQDVAPLALRGIPTVLSQTTVGFAGASEQAKVFSREIRNVVSGSERMAAGILAASQSQNTLAGSSEGAHVGLRRVETGLFAVASQAAGIPGPLAKVAEGLLLFGIGSTAILGVAAALAVVAIGWDLITKKEREARKATEDFIDAQVKASRGADPVVNVREAFEGVDEADRKVQGLRKHLEELNKQLDDLRKPVEIGPEGVIDVHGNDAAIAQVEQQIKNLKTATRQTGLDFLDPVLKARQQATTQAISDDLSALQQANQARTQVIQNQYAQELIGREEFFRQRQALAVTENQAEVGALQRQLTLAQNQLDRIPKNQTAARIDETAIIDHLHAQIALREAILRTQEKEIEGEHQLALATLFERAGIGTIGKVEQVQPVFTADQGNAAPTTRFQLKPQLDLSEINAELDRFNADTKRFQFVAEFERARLVGLELLPLLDSINLKLKDIGNANKNAPPFRTMAEQAVELADGIGRIGDALANVGVLSQEVSRDIGEVVSLGKSIASGDIAGIISGGINLIGSITGGSQDAQERNRIISENSDRLEKLAAALDRQLQGIGAAGTAQTLAAAAAADTAITSPVPKGESPTRLLAQQLAAAGLSVQEFANVIKDTTGIDVLDSKGRIIGKTLEQADAALKLYIKSQTSFAATLDEQTKRLDLGSRLRGEPQDARGTFGRELQAASTISPAVAEAFKGVDLKNQEAVRNAAVDLFNRFDQGFFTAHPEALGGLSKEDFLKFLEDSAGFLSSFNDGLAAATKNLQNVPDVNTLAELEFRARSPINRPGDGASLPLPNIDPRTTNPPPVTVPQFSVAGAAITTPLGDAVKSLGGGDTLKTLSDALSGRFDALSGGASLKDLLDAFRPPTAPATGDRRSGSVVTSPGLVNPVQRTTSQVIQHFNAPITVVVRGVADDPEATANRVKAVFLRANLASTGQED